MESDRGNQRGIKGENHFNSRSHVESDRIQIITRYRHSHFNSRSHVESDSLVFISFSMTILFQFTLSRGERLRFTYYGSGSQDISIHALTWRATFFRMVSTSLRCHFNSRSHVESDYVGADTPVTYNISIHALTWRATRRGSQDSRDRLISIHALTWRAT